MPIKKRHTTNIKESFFECKEELMKEIAKQAQALYSGTTFFLVWYLIVEETN